MRNAPSFHPAVRILVWVFFVVLAFGCDRQGLLVLSVLLTLLLVRHFRRFSALAIRSRWIAISLLLIDAYTLPGTAVFPGLSWASPTFEGIEAGLVQLWRIMLAIGALSVLLECVSREAILSGIYDLLWPLRLFRVDRERIALRLWLTLHYAESAQADGNWRERIDEALRPSAFEPRTLKLDLYRLRLADHAALGVMLVAGAWLL